MGIGGLPWAGPDCNLKVLVAGFSGETQRISQFVVHMRFERKNKQGKENSMGGREGGEKEGRKKVRERGREERKQEKWREDWPVLARKCLSWGPS